MKGSGCWTRNDEQHIGCQRLLPSRDRRRGLARFFRYTSSSIPDNCQRVTRDVTSRVACHMMSRDGHVMRIEMEILTD